MVVTYIFEESLEIDGGKFLQNCGKQVLLAICCVTYSKDVILP